MIKSCSSCQKLQNSWIEFQQEFSSVGSRASLKYIVELYKKNVSLTVSLSSRGVSFHPLSFSPCGLRIGRSFGAVRVHRSSSSTAGSASSTLNGARTRNWGRQTRQGRAGPAHSASATPPPPRQVRCPFVPPPPVDDPVSSFALLGDTAGSQQNPHSRHPHQHLKQQQHGSDHDDGGDDIDYEEGVRHYRSP